ncbi:conserved hypothetical protein [Pyrenophora tritici-repentis Pt-1C-BFP]|uniref:Uncharacterized protein n=1 Tax=Pyrenophora tritici-repentis (strain Pt-1C-BFP) TaxID=426418 RepID=B2W223_PYRTR|nr:uncharacterized protein PTRG_03471 [Pyrenophora tritici-repentis Pt-1C-BFP]EDU46309.1 conserved hypothetical protein [Pyrenophora tritici-repentis Pt-1C-BFP]
MSSIKSQDITLGNVFEQTKYYFFGCVSCQLLARTPRTTGDVDVVIENSSNALPDPHDWLDDEPLFWSKTNSQYVCATILEEEEDKDNILYQRRCFLEIDINAARWGSFPRFETIRNALVQLPEGCGLSLPRNELLKLKLAGWAEKSRREGPKKRNDTLDIVALQVAMYLEGEFLDQDTMTDNMKDGLKLWLQEMNDEAEWRPIGLRLHLTLLRLTRSREHYKFDFAVLSQIRTHIKSWWQQTPLPTTTASPTFQKWHNFDQEQWMPFVSHKFPRPGIRHQWAGSFRIIPGYSKIAGRGIIAGDFNPVPPEDDDLVRANDLTDAWTQLHPNSPGHTWGVYGEQSFPSNRFDKVALFNLSPSGMGILQTSELRFCSEKTSVDATESIPKAHFSDHLGLWCDVGWEEDRPRPE